MGVRPLPVVGQVVSHYRVLEKLGRGGMGVVYKAVDTALGRPVALKFLSDDTSLDPQGLERLRREARAASALDHSCICTVYEIGSHEGEPFIVMQLLEGKTLRQHAGGRPIDPDALLEIAIGVSDALEAAHSNGIIHRDIKPENVFVTGGGLVKVLDFGLVKPLQDTSDPQSNLTDHTVVTGTPAFMAPEMILGHDVDARADLYSLGCVAYWLLTGEIVFPAKTSMEMLVHHAHTAPAPPSQRTELAVPPAVDALVLSCLEKDPERRPADAIVLGARTAELTRSAPWSAAQARQWWDAHMERAGLVS